MAKEENSTFSHFFKEQSWDKTDGSNKGEPINYYTPGLAKKEVLPDLKKYIPASEDEMTFFWRDLRIFFRQANAKDKLGELYPISMSPHHSETFINPDYPLWITDTHFRQEGLSCFPLEKMLNEAINRDENPDNETILRKNIERLSQMARDAMGSKREIPFRPFIDEQLDQLQNMIEVSGKEKETFKQHISSLKKSLPGHGNLISLSRKTPLRLLEEALLSSQNKARNQLKLSVDKIRRQLKDLLLIEEQKGKSKSLADQLESSFSFVDNMLKFEKLSSLMPAGGSMKMPDVRRNRITKILEIFDNFDINSDRKAYFFVHEDLYKTRNLGWPALDEGIRIKSFKSGKGFAQLSSLFSEKLDYYQSLIAAKRIGELEIKNQYIAEVHDLVFEHFNWEQFSQEELACCPAFVMVGDDQYIFENEYIGLSRLISKNFPLKVLALRTYEQTSTIKSDPKNLHAPAEIAALMLSHKNIYLSQNSTINPESLFEEFLRGFSVFAPAFYHVLTYQAKDSKKSLLGLSATLQSRDFPCFTYDGLLGRPWGSRFHIDQNPDPDRSWPMEEHLVSTGNDEKKELKLPFTFAHSAFLNKPYRSHFKLVPGEFWREDLVHLVDFIIMNEQSSMGKIPFIWLINQDQELCKVAVSWDLVIATQERQDFWKFLQENCGVNNYHVAAAIEKTKEELSQKYELEKSSLIEAHNLELEQVRNEEAEKVMDNLSSMLLGLESNDIFQEVVNTVPVRNEITPVGTIQPSVVQEQDAAPVAEMVAEEEEDDGEPYIDTPLCTTCNECTNMNGAMFKYNDDKMAFIGDPKAGTFKQLVEAAELCPVSIIHPGSPLNPNEPDLEALIKRAEKYND